MLADYKTTSRQSEEPTCCVFACAHKLMMTVTVTVGWGDTEMKMKPVAQERHSHKRDTLMPVWFSTSLCYYLWVWVLLRLLFTAGHMDPGDLWMSLLPGTCCSQLSRLISWRMNAMSFPLFLHLLLCPHHSILLLGISVFCSLLSCQLMDSPLVFPFTAQQAIFRKV